MIPPNGTTSSYRNSARRGLQPNSNGLAPSSRGGASSSIHRPAFGTSFPSSTNPKLGPPKSISSQHSPNHAPTSFSAAAASGSSIPTNVFPVHSYNAAAKGAVAMPMRNGKVDGAPTFGRSGTAQVGIKRPANINTKSVGHGNAGLSSAPVGRSEGAGPPSAGYSMASGNSVASHITLAPKSARPPSSALSHTTSQNAWGPSSRDLGSQPNGHHKSMKKDPGPAISVKPSVQRDPRITRHPLRYTWVCWFMHRPPGERISNYAEAIKRVAAFSSIEDFWAVFSHMKRPNALPTISDYHLFRQGVRPVWEDEVNARGGKWIVRLRKGLAVRYWESLVLAVIGDQFGDNICGVVLSIRNSEDILSLWNQDASNGPLNLRIRDTLRNVLALPSESTVEYKRHASAIQDKSSFRNTDVFR